MRDEIGRCTPQHPRAPRRGVALALAGVLLAACGGSSLDTGDGASGADGFGSDVAVAPSGSDQQLPFDFESDGDEGALGDDTTTTTNVTETTTVAPLELDRFTFLDAEALQAASPRLAEAERVRRELGTVNLGFFCGLEAHLFEPVESVRVEIDEELLVTHAILGGTAGDFAEALDDLRGLEPGCSEDPQFGPTYDGPTSFSRLPASAVQFRTTISVDDRTTVRIVVPLGARAWYLTVSGYEDLDEVAREVIAHLAEDG